MIALAVAAALAAAALQATASTPSTTCAYTAGAAAIAVDGSPFAAEPSADGCVLYVPLAVGRGGAIAVLENQGGGFRLARTAPLPRPALGSSLSPDGSLLAVAAGDGVDLLSTSALRAGAPAGLGSVPLGSGAGAIQVLFSRDGALLFVSLERANAIAVLGLAITPDGARAWVSDSARFGGRNDVRAVDLTAAPPHVTATIAAAGDFPRDLRILADGRTVAAAVFIGRRVQLIPAP